MAKISVMQKDNISSMNVDIGGSMSSAQIRVNSKGNPVLIIGLGGTGMDALLCTKQLINTRFVLPESAPNKTTAIPDNIRVLGIDSDRTYFDKQREGGMRFAGNEYVSISSSVESYLANDHLIPEYVKEWLDDPKRLYSRVKGCGVDGANGIRQSGRVLLFNSIDKVVAAIQNDVKRLLTGMSPDQRLQVFVLSGISGGTGSGTFIDIPYIVRQIIENEGKENYDIMGVLFTPDVNISRISNPAIQKYVQRNGFAAIQELEYLMDMPDHHYDPFKQRYSSTFAVSSENSPYDICLLISATGKGGFVQKDPNERYDFSMSIAAEAVCNFIASSNNSGSFSIDSFRSNIKSTQSTIVPKFPMLNCFSSVGASSAILPKNEVLEYLSGQMFKGMNDLYGRSPNNEQRGAFLTSLFLDQMSVENMFDANLPILFEGGLNNPAFEKTALRASRLTAEELGQKWLNHVKDAYEATMKDCVDIAFTKFVEKVEIGFSDYNEGPFYISRLINSDDSYCVLKALKSSLEAERRAIESYTPQILKNKKDQADQAYVNFTRKFLDLTSTSRRDYFNLLREWFEMQQQRIRCEYTVSFYNQLITRINDYNNELIDNLIGILEELRKVFEKNLNIVTGIEYATTNGINTSYEWKMYNIKDNQQVLSELDDKISALDKEHAVSTLMKKLMTKFKELRAKDEFDIAAFISESISDHFSDLLTQTMDEYFQAQYPSAASREDAAKSILADLKQRSVIMFPCRSDAELLDVLYASIPEQSGSIEAAAKEDAQLSGGNLITSPYKNRISIFTFAAGLSPAHHNLMHLYEEGYYSFAAEGDRDINMIGQHLYSNFSGLRDTDWFGLPSPIHDELRPKEMITEKTAVVHAINQARRDEYEKARSLGIIDSNGIITDIPEITVADAEKLTYSGNDAAAAVKAKAALEELRSKLSPDSAGAKTYAINSMNYMNYANASAEDVLRETYIRNYGAWKYVKHMLSVYDVIDQAIETCSEIIEGQKSEKKELQAMFDALTARVVFKEKTFFRYTDNTGSPVNVLNLLKISENVERDHFFYYNLFEGFCALEKNQKIYISKKAEKAHADDIPDEDIEVMRKILEHTNASLQALDDLEIELPEVDEARNEKIIDTYKKLRDMAQSSLSLFA